MVTSLGYRVRPNSLLHGILEIKDQTNIASTAQLRREFDIAVNLPESPPFNLVVSMNNQTI